MAEFALLAVVLSALSLAFVAAAGLVARRELGALLPVMPRTGALAEPLLVVIPARNEAGRIGPVLRAVLAERGPLEVLVVDDRSSDGTADVVGALAREDQRLRLLPLVDDPPPGVFGKPRALQAALDDATARGPLPRRVLFLDADVELAPGALGGILHAFDHSGAAALSGVPHLLCGTAAEALFVPALVSVVTGRFPPSRVHRSDDDTAFLNGQLVVADTAALVSAGAWRAVCDTVLEDVALARRLKQRGLRLRLADLRTVARTRMYTSWEEIVEGFGKNAVALLGPDAGLLGALAFAVSVLPHAALIAAVWSQRTDVVVGTSAVVGVVLAAQTLLRRTAGAPLWPVLVLPLVYLGVAFVLGRASLRHLRRAPLAWRGRNYPSAPAMPSHPSGEE